MKLRWLTAERAQQVNIAGDCFLLAVAAVMLTVTNESPGINTMVAPALAFVMIFIWATAARVLRHYDLANGRRERGDAVVTLMLVGLGLGAFVLLRALVPPCARATETWRFALVLVPGAIWLRLMTSWMRLRREVPPPKVLVVGVGSLGRHTGHELRGARAPKEVIGYLRFEDDDETPNARLPAPALGTIEDSAKCIKERELDEVYLAGNLGTHHHALQKAISVCERFGIPFALPAAGFRFARAEPPSRARSTPDGYVHYLSVKHKPVQMGDQARSSTSCVLRRRAGAPLAAAHRGGARGSSSPRAGPVLFKQVRVGLYGRTFHMLKFRSMVVNAEELKAKLMAQNEQSGPVFKMKRDPRITAVGRFIRKYSIDELPQLINVLRGDMSHRRPAPADPERGAQYEAWQRRRLSVRPGLTCVWQVSGRNQISLRGVDVPRHAVHRSLEPRARLRPDPPDSPCRPHGPRRELKRGARSEKIRACTKRTRNVPGDLGDLGENASPELGRGLRERSSAARRPRAAWYAALSSMQIIARRSVLLVEDDPSLRGPLCRYLADMKFDVATAIDLPSAQKQLHERKPALVCLDSTLPRGSGYELCEYVRADVRLRLRPDPRHERPRDARGHGARRARGGQRLPPQAVPARAVREVRPLAPRRPERLAPKLPAASPDVTAAVQRGQRIAAAKRGEGRWPRRSTPATDPARAPCPRRARLRRPFSA